RSAILWKPPAHSPEENMVRQKCSGIRRSYLEARKAMMQWWSDYLEACRESYAPPYTIGKNKFIP
ncbi:integrase, partial [Klebsiella pneumoniae]